MVSDELVEKAADCIYMQMGFDPDGKTVLANGTPYGAWAVALAAARAALETIAPAIRAEAVEEERKGFKDPHAADWYWRDLDPDDSGYSINEAIHMMGEGVVCHVRSSFIGPDFFAAIVPVFVADSDDTEEITAETEEECSRLVQERYAAIRSMAEKETTDGQ